MEDIDEGKTEKTFDERREREVVAWQQIFNFNVQGLKYTVPFAWLMLFSIRESRKMNVSFCIVALKPWNGAKSVESFLEDY